MNLLQLRHANRVAFSASVLAFLALCACLVYWATVLLAPRSPIAPVEVVADPRANVDVRGAAALFGVGGNAAAPGPTITDIQVIGLAASRTRAAAILVLDGKPPRAYAEGDTLSRGVKLIQVAEDAVVIERDGARHKLEVPARPSLAILNSGAGRSRDAGAITPVPVTPVAPAPAAPYAPPPSAVPSPAPPPSMPPPPSGGAGMPGGPGAMPPNSGAFGAPAGMPPPPPQASMPPGTGIGQPNPLTGQMPSDANAPQNPNAPAPQ